MTSSEISGNFFPPETSARSAEGVCIPWQFDGERLQRACAGQTSSLMDAPFQTSRSSFGSVLSAAFFFAMVFLLFLDSLHSASVITPEFPGEPSLELLLREHGLEQASEEVLLKFIGDHEDSVGFWIADLKKREEQTLTREYLEFVEREGRADQKALTEFWNRKVAKLQNDRVRDPRRVTDAVLRELGRTGFEISLVGLLNLSDLDERPWVQWKLLASVQEMLLRVDPTKLSNSTMQQIPADRLAPLLRDLDAAVASRWAWRVWEHHKEWLMVSFRDRVPLRSRVWLARAFAAEQPQIASEVFREGLASQDATIRAATEMIVRTGLGGSLPWGTRPDQLLAAILKQKWTSPLPPWAGLPPPLDSPVLLQQAGRRADLVWLSQDGQIKRSQEDVWPLIELPLPNGIFYSRVGDAGREIALTDDEGVSYSRLRGLDERYPSLAFHGGVWAEGSGHAIEYATDGSILWETPLAGADCRRVVPGSRGQILLLGYKKLECRNRRGDILWHLSLEGLDDPREIIAVTENRFLLICTNSIGWLSKDGRYEPILTGLGSAGWVRYHSDHPWVIFDEASCKVIFYDAKLNRELGRLDIDDGPLPNKSRFIVPPAYFPE